MVQWWMVGCQDVITGEGQGEDRRRSGLDWTGLDIGYTLERAVDRDAGGRMADSNGEILVDGAWLMSFCVRSLV